MSERTLKVELREGALMAPEPFRLAGVMVEITPPISEDFWLARVQLSPSQAVVAFPKFSTIGIGFQREEDWNTNLPYTCDAAAIYDHIKHNKGDASISRATCIRAIELLQEIARKWRASGERAAGPSPEGEPQ